MLSFIHDFGILLVTTVVISFIIKLFRQPIIIGYVLAGFLFSFLITKGSTSGEQIIILSELGIMFLLFLMGLELNLKNLKYLGKDLLIATTIQSIIFFLIALIPALLFGFKVTEGIYLAILFMFSSTLLVAKWIEDKKEMDILRGKVILGTLVVQDLFVIIIISILGVIGETSFIKILWVPFGGLVLILTAFIFAKYLLDRLLKIAVKYPELLFIFSLGVCFFFVEISQLFGYSPTIGAFIAGVTLANTHYKNEIYSRLKPLIIFFNMLFFVGMGFQIKLGMSLKIVLFIAILCIIGFIIKPIVIYFTLKLRGYDFKTAFSSGLNLAQLSEFGIIIVAGAALNGLVSSQISTIAIICVITSMVISSYMIKYDKNILRFFETKLKSIDEKFSKENIKEEKVNLSSYSVLFFGFHGFNKELISKLEGLGKKILVIENDPSNIEFLKKEGIPYVYNSVNNPYFFNRLDFKQVELVVSGLIDVDENKLITNKLKEDNKAAVIIVTAKNIKDSLDLYDNGADYVVCPSYINEQHVSVLLEDYAVDINNVINKKIGEITKLREMHEKRRYLEPKFEFNITRFFDMFSKKAKQAKEKK